MKTYKICIESWTKAVPLAKGYDFENYNKVEKEIIGFNAAIKEAKKTKQNLSRIFSIVIIRDATPGALCGIARRTY